MNFESAMMYTNYVVFMDLVCDFVDTKSFSSTRLLHSSCLFLFFLGRWWYYCCCDFIALSFGGSTCLWSFVLIFWLDIPSLINRLCVLCSHAHFTPSCVLYFLYEQSSPPISFCLILFFCYSAGEIVRSIRNFF